MEVKSLLYFMAVVEQGSFTRAAKQRGVTQPALSVHISELEDELGVELLERSHEGTRPTFYGQMLYDRTLPVIRNIVGAVEHIGAIGHAGQRAIVRLGMPPALCQYILPGVLDQFFEEWPGVSVEVREGFSADLSGDVEAGVLDLAIGGWTPANVGLRQEFAYQEDLHLVSGSAIAGPSGEPCRLDDIPGLQLCCVAENHPLGALVRSHIVRGNIRPERTAVIDGMGAGVFALSPSWAGIVPTSAARALTGQAASAGKALYVYPIEFPRVSYQVYGISNSKVPLRPPAFRLKEMIVGALAASDLGRLSVRRG